MTTAVVPHVIERNIEASFTLRLLDDGEEPENWFGIMLRGIHPRWPDNCFVCFRSSGDIDVMNRLGEKETFQSGLDWKAGDHEVMVQLDGVQLRVTVDNTELVNKLINEVPVRPGRVYIHAYRSRWEIGELSLLSAEPNQPTL